PGEPHGVPLLSVDPRARTVADDPTASRRQAPDGLLRRGSHSVGPCPHPSHGRLRNSGFGAAALAEAHQVPASLSSRGLSTSRFCTWTPCACPAAFDAFGHAPRVGGESPTLSPLGVIAARTCTAARWPLRTAPSMFDCHV